jgi:hypothetical protein
VKILSTIRVTQFFVKKVRAAAGSNVPEDWSTGVMEYWSNGWDGEPVLSDVEGSIYRAPHSWTFLNSLFSSFFNG